MKNIHILPTSQPSRLWTNNLRRRLELDEFPSQYPTNIAKQIYITNSEEIKGGDWTINTKGANEIYKVASFNGGVPLDKNGNGGLFTKKIILTTDQDLIKDGVQAIDDEFLEWFVQNPSCEEVEVDCWTVRTKDKVVYDPPLKEYEIIIPKEEPDYTALLKQVGTTQETLEEAMNQNGYHESDYDKIWREGVEFGTKWQAEQLFKDDAIKTLETCMALLLKKIEGMYSEEEVNEIISEVWLSCEDNEGETFTEARKRILEQFKKK